MPDTLHLTVTGMSCGGCEAAVTRALGQMPGIDGVVASHAANRVEVTFDGNRITPQAIAERIMALGYDVQSPA